MPQDQLAAINIARGHISLLEVTATQMKALEVESKISLHEECVVVMYRVFSKISSSVVTAIPTAGSMSKFCYSLLAGELLYSVPRFIA